MAPSSVTVESCDVVQLQKDKARHLAITLVTKYLRSVVKSDKLANKFQEDLSTPLLNSDCLNTIKKEITIEEVLKKDIAGSENEKGPASSPSIKSVLVYKYIQENTSDKFAQKFAKKTKFPYQDLYNNLTKKEQKLSLDRACRKFLKKREECNSDDTGANKQHSKKRKLECSSSDGEGDSPSPKPKKKKMGAPSIDTVGDSSDSQKDAPKEVDLPKAPKNNKPCFKCNQPGHFAKDCTSEITCYNCSKVGHTSKECPNSSESSSGKNSNITCYNCDQTGHNKRNCPELTGDGKKKNFDMECYNCKETGHLSRDCTKDGGVACYNCGSNGHLSRNCTESSTMLCYNCKKPGHISKDCKVEDGATSKMLCFKCNQMGHMARSCTNVADDTRRRSSYGNNSRG